MNSESPSVLLSDIAWCWWTRPRATRIDRSLFLGALDSDGGIVAARLDVDTRVVQRKRLAQFEDDDHNNPALLAVPDRPLICFYSRHDAEEGLRYRISKVPLEVDSWDEEKILTFGGSTTYAQVHALGANLHLFTRVEETRWGWRMSPDWGESWSPPRDFLSFTTDQQVYMATALLEDGRTLRVAVSGHPKDYEQRPLHDVWACTVDLVSGDVTLPGSGTWVGNLRTGEHLPLDYGQLELVQRTPTDRTVNLFDVSSGSVFEIAFVSKQRDNNSTIDARYHVAYLRSGAWTTDTLVPAGAKFGYIDAGFYVGGMAFPERAAPGQVYLTREAAGLWHWEFWRRSGAGSWSGSALLPPAPRRLARPWAVEPPAPELGAVALALEYYPDDSYYGTLSHLVGAPLPKDFSR